MAEPGASDQGASQTKEAIFSETDALLQGNESRWMEKWKDVQFNKSFPQLVSTLLSPEGLERYSGRDRRMLFAYGWPTHNVIYGNHRVGMGNDYLQAAWHSFRADGAILENYQREAGWNFPRSTEVNTLAQAETAGLLLLGMSSDTPERAMGFVVSVYEELPETKKRVLKQRLDLMLTLKNPIRSWIKDKKLDLATGFDWDTQLAELSMNMPENRLDTGRASASKLPSELRDSNLYHNYSPAAVDVFLDYAMQYATSVPLNPRRELELIEFVQNVRHMPEDFVMLPPTQVALQTIHKAARPGPRSGSSRPAGIGVAHQASELLPKPPKTAGPLRWLPKGVTQLLG